MPIPYNITTCHEDSKLRMEIVKKQTLQNEEVLDITAQTPRVEQTATESCEPLCENLLPDDVHFQRPPPVTYRSARLNFDTPLEEEDVMEWIHLEPPKHEKISTEQYSQYKKNQEKKKQNNEKNAKLQATINALKSEIKRVRCQNKYLKYRLRMALKYKKPKSKKQKKEALKKIVDEQKLHPVAKAMIHLQLHTPRTVYTEQEKTLSRQLYYYSTAAFCRLRKAGCNFPGQRTIRRWLEEYDIRPGFCDFIFEKLKEKISRLPMEERVCALKWDEMYIKSYEEYSSKFDEIEGLVDLGPLGKSLARAKCVFAFCLDSLNARHPWRQPLAYFLSGKLKQTK